MTQRLTTAEAGKRLGVSGTQIRRLVAAGKLQAEIEERPQGTRLIILWSEDETAARNGLHTVWPPDATTGGHVHENGTHRDATEDEPDATQVATDETGTFDRDHLLDEIAWLRSRLEAAEQERAQLRELVAREQATVSTLRQLLLPEHATGDTAGVATRTPPDAPVTHQGPRRRWWAFWNWS
jgi:hypothetical protein